MTSAYLLSVLGFASGLMLAVVLGVMEVSHLFPLIQDGASVVGVLIVVFAFLKAQQNARIAFERTLVHMVDVQARTADAAVEAMRSVGRAIETRIPEPLPRPVPKIPAPDFPMPPGEPLPRSHD